MHVRQAGSRNRQLHLGVSASSRPLLPCYALAAVLSRHTEVEHDDHPKRALDLKPATLELGFL